MKKISAAFLIVFAATGCAPKEREEPVRQNVQAIDEGAAVQASLSPLPGALETVNLGACERLGALREEETNGPGFSYLGSARQSRRGEWTGALAVENSPFTQFILGEKFAAGDEEEFFKKAKEEMEAGRIGTMKWLFVRFMRGIGALSVVQYSATNDKLEENFPGIFGSEGPLEGALFFKLAKRAADLKSINGDEAARILSARMNLFPGGGDWQTLAVETRLSLGAALNGLKSESAPERLCAQVLLHQHFAQLLRFKGHQSPGIQAPKRRQKLHRIEKLSASQPEFRTVDVNGALYDVKARHSIVLHEATIAGYDPGKQLLAVRSRAPGHGSDERGDLGASLSFMEALTYGFEATSPASLFTEEKGYVFGDVAAENGSALVPAEAHSLSLGLLTMHFKNLALLHIRKVNAQGRALGDGEQAAGIVLVSEDENGHTIRLDEAIRLARVSSYLEKCLSRFRLKPQEVWEKLNPVYSKKTMAALLGLAIFSEKELDGLLSAEEKSSILRNNLNALKFTLALLIAKMGAGEQGCFSAVDWNGETGAMRPLATCTGAQMEEMAAVFDQLAHDTNSSLMKRKAEEIRRKIPR